MGSGYTTQDRGIETGINPPNAGGSDLVAAIRASPLESLTQQARLHGDIFSYETGEHDTLVLNHPAYARHVLVDHWDRYSKNGTPELDMLRSVLGDGLMTVEGPEWIGQRALATPQFSEERLRTYFPLMEREIAELFDRWAQLGSSERGLDVGDELSSLTLRIVAQCLFEATLSQEEAGDVGSGVGALNEFMASGPNSRGAVHDERCRAMEKMAGIVWSIVCAGAPRGSVRDSLLSALLRRVTNPEPKDLRPVGDQVLTFLMAGHETTAKALTWTLYLLASRPDVQDALWREAGAVEKGNCKYEQLSGLSGFESVLYESMRLYPPVWMISRKAICDDRIGGYRIGHGSLVVISPYLLHRHSAFWPDAENFDAARFAAGAGGTMRECSYIPFGAGPRTCIGRRFAMVEMMLFLVTLVQRFRIRSVGASGIYPQALVTLRPASEVRIRLEAR